MGFHFNVNTSKRIEDWNAYRENIDMAFKWNRHVQYSFICCTLRVYVDSLSHSLTMRAFSSSFFVSRAQLHCNNRKFFRKNLTRVGVFGFGVPILV